MYKFMKLQMKQLPQLVLIKSILEPHLLL